MPAPSSSGKAISRRGLQLAAATVLGSLVVLALAGALALGLFEAHMCGAATWLRP